MFNDQKKLSILADPDLHGRYPMRGLYQALGVASMCVHEDAAGRPLIADVVTALSYLESQTYEPKAVLASSRCPVERRSRRSRNEMPGREKQEEGCNWEVFEPERDETPEDIAGILNKDVDRERAVAEAMMWGANSRQKQRATMHEALTQ